MWGEHWSSCWRRERVMPSLVVKAVRLGLLMILVLTGCLLLRIKVRMRVPAEDPSVSCLKALQTSIYVHTLPGTDSAMEDTGVGVGVKETDAGVPKTPVLPGCPSTPPHLLGQLEVVENVTVEEAEGRQEGRVRRGGFWWPGDCVARWKVAIIVPYRDRQHQMGPFLDHMHSFLQRQQLNYSIYIVEQDGMDLFNRARLLNVGFLESRKEGPWDCYAFHDVDMLPENDYHLYHCSPQPRHLTVSTSSNNYRLYYYTYYGGACLMTEAHILRVNGWSNVYWGWGGEDDDMWRRIAFTDMAVWRYPARYSRYKMIQHKPQTVNKNRYKVLARSTGRFPKDGLNSLRYTVRSVTRYPLYTHILADIGSSSENVLPREKPRVVDAQKYRAAAKE